MSKNEVILRFEEVSFSHGHNHPILIESDFSVRRGSKITLMGQNGAGKSTIFQMIMKSIQPESGDVHITNGLTIATARQVIPRDQMNLTIREFFEKCFDRKIYDIDPRIDDVLEVVNLKGHEKLHDRIIKSFLEDSRRDFFLLPRLFRIPTSCFSTSRLTI